VGARNRRLFFIYLLCINAQAGLALFLTTFSIDIYNIDYKLVMLFTALLVGEFLLGSLLVLHFYIMFRGITTWELLRPQTSLERSPITLKRLLNNLRKYWIVRSNA